jgi:hypothetical protein
MRFAGLALVLVCGCGAADLPRQSDSYIVIEHTLTATPDEQASILMRIASNDPVEAAWGAYLAGEHGIDAAIEPLMARLATGIALDYVEDALARLGAHVSPEQLSTSSSATAIAIQNPSEHAPRLLAAWRAASEFQSAWGAYANALAAAHDHMFAKALLESLTSTVTVSVYSPDVLSAMGGGCRCGGISTCGSAWASSSDSVMPPSADWYFAAIDDADCVAVLPGPADVCLARQEYYGARSSVTSTEPVFDEDEEEEEPATSEEPPDPTLAVACAEVATANDDSLEVVGNDHNSRLLDYIATLTHQDASFDGDVAVRHTYRDAASYRRLTRDIRFGVQASYAALVQRMDEARLLDEGPRDVTVDFDVWDGRTCGVTSHLPAAD